MSGVLVAKYYSELRRESSEEAARRPRSLGQKLLRRHNKPGWMMATEDTKPFYFAGYKPGVNPDYTARQVKHFSRNVQKVAGRSDRGAANVGKRLVDEERHTSIPRLVGMGAGMGAIAWGGSRSKMLRRALREGGANGKLDPRVRHALNLAEHTRQSLETTTSPLGRVTGRGVGRMPAPLKTALNDVPRSLRPATATLAGAILVQHARPVRQSTYSPVVEMGGY